MSKEFWYGAIAAVVLVYLLNAAIAHGQTGPATATTAGPNQGVV